LSDQIDDPDEGKSEITQTNFKNRLDRQDSGDFLRFLAAKLLE